MDWIAPTLSAAGTVLLYSLRLAIWPLSALFAALAVLLSPVTYTIQYSVAPFLLLISVFPRLEPLYIFFGCAAFVGIIAGTSLQATSGILTSIFGLDAGSREAAQTEETSAPAGVKRLEEQSWQESDWQWLEKTPEPNIRKRRTHGLLSQTILEEDDDSE